MSGNKVRKLEFLMADAMAQGADCIITIGGIQSNHCRATAVAAKYMNLDCYLILRTSKVSHLFHFFCILNNHADQFFPSPYCVMIYIWQVLVDEDPGLTGNLLVERLVGAHVDLVSKEEYAKIGALVCPLLVQHFGYSLSRTL